MSISQSCEPVSPEEKYYDLGSFNLPISTKIDAAQIWFDRGLIWSYRSITMKHPDASRRPFAHDPKCAMAFWGLTYATGPNYNKSWLMFDRDDLNKSIEKCHHAAKTALHLAQTESVTPVEMALIKAIQLRFPDAHPASDFSAVNDAYATAMFDVYQHFGADDLNVTTLYADALMHTALRKMFHVKTGLPIEDSPVHKVRNMFDIAFQNRAAETHCGLLHFWIHFINIPITSGPCMDTMSVY